MGAILGALIGRHLAHTEEQHQTGRKIALAPIYARIADPTNPAITQEDVDTGMQIAKKNHYIDNRTVNTLQVMLDAAQKKWDAARGQEKATSDAQNAPPTPGGQGQSFGMPLTNAATAPPVAAQPPQPQLPPPPQFSAAGGGGLIDNTPSPGLAAPYQTPPSPDNSAILQRLLPALLAAKTAQARGGMQNSMLPGTTPPGMGPGTAPGIPQNGGATLPPANGGAGAGPTPPAQGQPGENPQMVLGAAKGGTGFNVMPPADVASPVPTQLAQNVPPRPTGLFPYRNSPTLEQVAAIKGRAAVAGQAPALEAEAEFKRKQLPLDYAAREAMYKDKPWFQHLPEIFQAQLLSGQTIPGIGAHFSVPGTVKSQPGDVGMDGLPVDPDLPGKRTYINGSWVFTPLDVKPLVKDVWNPDGTVSRHSVDPYTNKDTGPIAGLTNAPMVREIRVDHADGTTSRVGVTRTGVVMSEDPRLRGINIAALPKENNTFKEMDDGSGNKFLVPVTTTRGPVLPGNRGAAAGTSGSAPTPPASIPYVPGTGGPVSGTGGARVSGTAIPFGARSIPPGQRITFEQKARVFDNTMDLVKSVQSRLPILNSLIAAKKIEMQIDPQQGTLKALINRNVPLTKEEEQLAGDFASLTEHINTLRGPLGAAGFRGPEAFAALQQQRGNLLANPNVTKIVLANTMKALQGQRNAIRQGLDKGKPVPQWAVDMPASENAINNPPDGTPTHSIPELGSTFNGGKVLKVTPIK